MTTKLRYPVLARHRRHRGARLARRQHQRRRQRRALLALNDHALKDIGLSSADAWQEGHKPFWRT